MHILIINLHSSANLGDAAITTEMVRQFKETFPAAKITLAFNDPKSHPSNDQTETIGTFRSWVLSINEHRQETWHIWRFPFQLLIAFVALITHRWFGQAMYLTQCNKKRQLMEAYFEADMVVGCGGQVLSTKRRLAVSFYWIVFSTLYGYWAGKPVYMYPQTIGPVVHWHHKTVINYLIKRVRLVMARDNTYKTVLSPTMQAKTILLPDAAFGLHPKTSHEGWTLLASSNVQPNPSKPTVGMTVMNWVDQDASFSQAQQDRYDEAIVQLLRHIVHDLGGRVFMFGQVTGPTEREDDRLIAKKLMAKAGLEFPDVVLFEKLTTIESLLTAYATLDMMVGTRMHSTIMSLVSRIPVCAISYLNKAKSTFELVGLSAYATCDIRTITTDQLITMFDHAWKDRLETKHYLEQRIPELAQMAQSAPELIKQDWLKNNA